MEWSLKTKELEFGTQIDCAPFQLQQSAAAVQDGRELEVTQSHQFSVACHWRSR
jgi:hypothetical protein